MNVSNYSREDIVKWMELLRTQFHDGTKLRLRKLWHTEFPSIQGPWTPFTFKDPSHNLVQFPNVNIVKFLYLNFNKNINFIVHIFKTWIYCFCRKKLAQLLKPNQLLLNN